MNNIGDEGAITLSEMLKMNKSLRELNLECEEKGRKEKKENQK